MLPWKGGSSLPSHATSLSSFIVFMIFVSIAAQATGSPFLVNFDKMIVCWCTTDDCKASGFNTCNTTSKCYTQFLDKKDGSETVFRGCTTNMMPLLCENRPPASIPNSNWPLLLCCQESYCNKEGVPSPPPWHHPGNQTNMMLQETTKNDLLHLPPTDENANPAQGAIGAVYIVVLVVGVFLLFVIGGFAVVFLRRQSRGSGFGIDRSTYLKGQCTKNSVTSSKNGDILSPKLGYYSTNELIST